MPRGNIDYDQIRAAARKGNGSLIQMAGASSYVAGNAPIFDANGNLVDSGAAPGGSGSTSSNLSGTIDIVPGSPNTMDDEFIAGSLDAKWTYVNSPSGALTFNYGRMLVAASGYGALTQPMPTAPCEFMLKFSSDNGTDAGNPWTALGFSDGTKYVILAFGFINSAWRFEVENMSAYNTYSSSPATTTIAGYRSGEWWAKIKNDGTNLIFSYSITGAGNYTTVATLGKTAYMGGGPTLVAIHWLTGVKISIDYFRRTL